MQAADNRSRVEQIVVDPETPVITALKKMDERQVKLLLVLEGGVFRGLLSIGDVQRAIIRNYPLTDPLGPLLRKDLTVARSGESIDAIRRVMLLKRTEFMPVVGANGVLERVWFWDELIGAAPEAKRADLRLPVVIMAGGKGTRLKPITNVLPKALIPVGERTMLEHIVDRFVLANCTQFFLTLNYRAEMIEQYMRSLGQQPWSAEFFREPAFLGTGGSLSLLKDRLTSTFFVSNCDVIVDADYGEIHRYHVEAKNDLTVVGVVKSYSIPYGVLETGDDGRLTGIREKPELTFKINSGMYLLEPHLLSRIPRDAPYNLTDLIESVRHDGRVGVFPVSEGAWMDVGEWSEYNKTAKRLGFAGVELGS